MRSGLVFKTNGCSSGTVPSCTKAAQERIKSWHCMVVWQIAQLDTLTEMPNKMLRVIFQGQQIAFLGFHLPPMQKGSSATVLHVSLSSASAQNRTIRGTVSSAPPAFGWCHLTWTWSFSSFLLSDGTSAFWMEVSKVQQMFGKRCSAICWALFIFEPFFFCPPWLGPMPAGVHGKLHLNWMSFADPVL